MRIRRQFQFAVLAAALVAASFAAPATAYQPVYMDGGGGDLAVALYCTPGLLALSDPIIAPVPHSDLVSSMRRQWVAWNVSIYYSSDLTNWTLTNAPAYWYFGQAADSPLGNTYNAGWYSEETKSWGFQNDPRWSAFLKGYYAATMQVIWYLEDGTVATVNPQLVAYTMGAGGLWSDRSPYCTEY